MMVVAAPDPLMLSPRVAIQELFLKLTVICKRELLDNLRAYRADFCKGEGKSHVPSQVLGVGNSAKGLGGGTRWAEGDLRPLCCRHSLRRRGRDPGCSANHQEQALQSRVCFPRCW